MKIISYTTLIFIFLHGLIKTGCAQINVISPDDALNLKNEKIELVIGNHISDESLDSIETVFEHFWKYSSYEIVRYNDYLKHGKEDGHFYIVPIRARNFNALNDSAILDPMDIVSKPKTDTLKLSGGRKVWGGIMNLENDSLSSLFCFALIKSGGDLNKLVRIGSTILLVSPGFHNEKSLIDPLDLLIVQGILEAAFNTAKKLTGSYVDQSNRMSDEINKRAHVLADRKLLVPLNVDYVNSGRYSAGNLVMHDGNIDTTKLHYTTKLLHDRYKFPVAFNPLTVINYESIMELESGNKQKHAYVLFLEYGAPGSFGVYTNRYTIIFDAVTNQLVYYEKADIKLTSEFLPDLQKVIAAELKSKK